jgi:hypothetical protein
MTRCDLSNGLSPSPVYASRVIKLLTDEGYITKNKTRHPDR